MKSYIRNRGKGFPFETRVLNALNLIKLSSKKGNFQWKWIPILQVESLLNIIFNEI